MRWKKSLRVPKGGKARFHERERERERAPIRGEYFKLKIIRTKLTIIIM